MRVRVLVVAGLLLVAGCAGTPGEAPSTTPEPGETATTSTIGTTTTIGTTPQTHPWDGRERLTVNVTPPVNESRRVGHLVVEAAQYWTTGPGEQYRDYEAELVVDPYAEEADVTVVFTEEVSDCYDAVGCAPVLDERTRAEAPEVIEIRSGMSENTTLEVLRHEFGHLFGRDHGEAPRPLMDPGVVVTWRDRTDADNRTNPWQQDTLRLALNESTLSAGEQAQWHSELEEAVTYLDAGAEGAVPQEIDVVLIDNASAADVVVRQTDAEQYTPSYSRYRGTDNDTDPQLEAVTRQPVLVNEETVSSDVAWHTAYWVAMKFAGVENLPATLAPDNYERDELPV